MSNSDQRYSNEEIAKMSREELYTLAAENARFTSFTYCPNCKCVKEMHARCWNCDYGE